VKDVLIVGANGFLGTHLMRVGQGLDVNLIPVDHKNLDVTNRDEVIECVRNLAPTTIVNVSCVKKMDVLEDNAPEAFAVNAEGAANVAIAATDVGSQLIHVSADYVFDGDQVQTYVESDLALPISIYGWSKLAGDLSVQSVAPNSLIIRPSGMLGRSGGPNFLSIVLGRVASNEPLSIVDDQVLSPTSASEFSNAILSAAIEGFDGGVFHCAGGGQASWYDIARYITDHVGRTNYDIRRVQSDSLNQRARRPKNSSLDSSVWNSTQNVVMRNWQDNVEIALDYIA